jgi:hypothetical protein
VSLEHIDHFVVPAAVVDQTMIALREAGNEGFERFVLWSGVRDVSRMNIRTAHVPEQTAYKTSAGLMVKVEGGALHKLNAWLYKNQETLAVQVHAHPTDAFHSATDDAYPIVTVLGGLSLVVPDFGARGFLVRGLEAYRLRDRGWRRVRPRRFRRLFEVA